MNPQANTQNLVKIANEAIKIVDFLGSSIKYHNTDMIIEIEYYSFENLSTELREWTFELLKLNMKKTYENSNLGWNEKEKRKEMSDKDCRYLIALNNGKPIGFVMFQFSWEETMSDDDEEIEVIYCYEIQLSEIARNKGLGTFLMRTLEEIGRHWKMKKLILTAIDTKENKTNKSAIDFYLNHLGYQIDEISPSKVLLPEEAKDYDYEIISKVL
ncbi:2521_t:CDS:2 [Funneliformis caledonium]|uniref:N-alpha-acetyltransferase 40 n=1 Tax=Funneliformis caledonium TaxID=1117310 RepID=A0A9N8ZGG9_9GLOM|nr:2521_t:CDS:2 [Funneliformis caledonium]